MVWYAEQGFTYYILVHGFRSDVGDFQLDLTLLSFHDSCDTAIHIEHVQQSKTIFGSVSGASVTMKMTCLELLIEEIANIVLLEAVEFGIPSLLVRVSLK